MTAFLAKLNPWNRASRKIVMGSNLDVLPWIDCVRREYALNPSVYDTLCVIATHMGREAWDGMRLCIAWITERVSWSRRTVERALAFLRSVFLLRQDGEIPVRMGRPVVRYRLGGTPECPLPWAVVEVRESVHEDEMGRTQDLEETAGQGGNGVYHFFTEGSVVPQAVGETPESPSRLTNDRGSQYRSAPLIKTGPSTDRSPRGSVRRPSHLRWLRRLAVRLLDERGTRTPVPVPLGSQDGCGDVGGMPTDAGLRSFTTRLPTGNVLPSAQPEEDAMQPFIDPVFGCMSRDTRYLYLGLLEAARLNETNYSDTLFLKSQFFPYDSDMDPMYLENMLETLTIAGKIHIVGNEIVLSNPPVTTGTAVALFDFPGGSAPSVLPPFKQDYKLSDINIVFDKFWKIYPRRSGKGAARKAFLAACQKVNVNVIMDAVAAYAENLQQIGRENQYIPYPATWLNQERWGDDLEMAPQVRSRVDDALRAGMDLVGYYQQQEVVEGTQMKELEW